MMDLSFFKILIKWTYSYIRVCLIIVFNIYHIPTYLFINWFLLYPLALINPQLYNKIENILYNWCLYTVSSWSWFANINVYECGDNIETQINLNSFKKSKILILSNHQSTGDVPLLMQALTSHEKYVILWIISSDFKFTNFGLVSQTHQDYFLDQNKYKQNDLLNHCLNVKDKNKNCFLLFPEGGFRFKRKQGSDKFALKNNLTLLKRVVWPRYKAFEEMLNQKIGITHLVDLTVIYPDPENPISILDIAKGLKEAKVYFIYKIYKIEDENEISFEESGDGENNFEKIYRNSISEEWLRNLWLKKEQQIESFYQDKNQFLKNVEPLIMINLSLKKLILIHFFYLASFIIIIYSIKFFS